MTFGKKLGVSFGAVALCAGAVAISSLVLLNRLSAQLDICARDNMKKMELLSEIRSAVGMMRFGNRGILLYSSVVSARDVEAARKIYSESRESIHASVRQLTAAGSIPQAVRFNADETGPIGKRLLAATGQLVKNVQARNAQALADADRLKNTAYVLLTVLLAICGSCWAGGGVAIRRATRQIGMAAEELRTGAIEIHGTAQELAGVSQVLAQGATEQAASIEETSASTQQLSAMTRGNAEAARHAAELMEKAEEMGGESQQAMNTMAGTMQAINQASAEVSRVIKVIDEIAFQTNILALNAAVEAARAGEAGMGFAVVADEVRNLAQRSSQAARETAELIERSVTGAREGNQRVAAVTATFCESARIRTDVRRQSDQIAQSCREQATGIDQIAAAMAEMSSVIQATAGHADRTSSASGQLETQAAALNRVVEQLSALVCG
jgi:methyl-accepting chemotaxis protein